MPESLQGDSCTQPLYDCRQEAVPKQATFVSNMQGHTTLVKHKQDLTLNLYKTWYWPQPKTNTTQVPSLTHLQFLGVLLGPG